MCKAQWVLALLALHVGLAHSWDIAVSLGDQLVFYTNGTITNTVNFVSHNLTALAYDEVHNMMLYIDKQRDNDAICGYNLLSMENKCFIKRNGSDIQSIAYDPPTERLFFTDANERTINWISLKPAANNNVYGNLLIKMRYVIASNIAVDSCTGYIHWTNFDSYSRQYMERINFNVTEIDTIIHWLPVFSFAIDQQTRQIYYFDGCKGCSHNFLKKRDLTQEQDVDYHEIKFFAHQHLSAPKELTASKDYLYWMDGSESSRTFWYLPKNAEINVQPNEMMKFYNKIPLAIAANYKIKDQIQGRQDCEALSNLIPTITETNTSLNIQQTIQKHQKILP